MAVVVDDHHVKVDVGLRQKGVEAPHQVLGAVPVDDNNPDLRVLLLLAQRTNCSAAGELADSLPVLSMMR